MSLAFDLVGAEVLFPGGLRQERLSVAGGVLCADPVGRAVDLSGFRVLPGIVDLHGDAFERHLAPRRGAMTDMGEGLRATEAELAANGITTGVLAQFLSWEGVVNAFDGPAAFTSSTDIGVQEDGTTVTGDQSLQLCGTGTNYAEMLSSGGWQAPALNSRGLLQACQTIPGGSGDTTLDEFDVTDLMIGGTLVSVDIGVSSNGVPYSLIYSTNLLTDPEGTGTADTQNGNGGSITLQDDITGKDFRIYWIRSN